MAHKPSLTSQMLHAAVDLARQALKAPVVQDVATHGFRHAGRELAHKVETGLRKRGHKAETSPGHAPEVPPRRTGVLVKAMHRATALRPDGAPGIAAQILGEAEATYQRVNAEYDGLIAEAHGTSRVDAELPGDGPLVELPDTPVGVPEREPQPYRLTGPIDRMALGGAETFSAAGAARRPRTAAELDRTEARAELAAEGLAHHRAELDATEVRAELEDTSVRAELAASARP